LVLLPATVGFLYVRAFGVSVVYTDAWSMVPLFNKWAHGKLTLSDLYAQHNEHRMFFPETIQLLLGVATKYNNMVEMYLIEVCFLVTLGILLLAFRSGTRPALVLFVPISLLVFSLMQYENMLLGYQINFAFTQMFGVLTIFLLYIFGGRSPVWLSSVAALGSATVASFSTAQGLLVWPAGLLQLLIGPVERQTKRILVVVWSLAGLAEWVAYFVDFRRSPDKPSLLYAIEHPLEGASYFLTLLGSSLSWEQTSAFLVGLLLVCLTLVSLLLLVKNRKVGEYSFWVSLLFYSLLILASITAGRSAYGAWQAMAPRYTTFSILVVVSLYAILVKTLLERRSAANTVLLIVLSGVILLSAAISYPAGILVGKYTEASRERAALLLTSGKYKSLPDAALAESFGTSQGRVVRENAPILKRLHYNVFSEPRAQGEQERLTTEERGELRRLRRKVKELRQEIDSLKAAVASFAREHGIQWVGSSSSR
jgi:hypothetical protein